MAIYAKYQIERTKFFTTELRCKIALSMNIKRYAMLGRFFP